jgi:hypothetical protein
MRFECQDALRLAIVPRTPAICALLAFSFGHDSAYNFLLKRGVLPFCSSLESQMTPELLSLFTQDLVRARGTATASLA